MSEPQGVRRVRGYGSLRLRLTAVATALLATGLALFGTLVYAVSARTLDVEIDRALADRARVVIAQVTVVSAPTGLQVQLPDVDAIAAGGAVVQVTGFDGTIVRSALLGRATLPLSEAARRLAEAGESSFETTVVEGVRLRIATAPLAWRGETLGVLLVARPLLASELVTDGLRIVLALTGTVVLVIGAAVAWLVSMLALRPLDDFAREAHVIGRAQDFGRRLPPDVTASVAEVGTLGVTFNAMLDRLQEAYGAVQDGSRRLEAALQSQRRFIADASHELRTPLTTIRGNAQLLQRGDAIAPPDRDEMVDQISSEAERMARLVGDLLTLARADGGLGTHGARQSVMVRPLVESVASQARILAAGRVAVSVVPYTGDGDLEVSGDPDALRQLLLALVDNAIKYTPTGGSVTFALSSRPSSAGQAYASDPSATTSAHERGQGSQKLGAVPGSSSTHSNTAHTRQAGLPVPQTLTETPQAEQGMGLARVSVIDTGIGIAPEDVPHIFERFFRADRARHTAGSGLGLSIARWIAEAHGGSISVESSLGAGSMFTVVLPARLVGAAHDDAA